MTRTTRTMACNDESANTTITVVWLPIAICTTLSTFQKHTISATLQGMLRMLRCKRTTCSFDDALESPTDSLFVFVVVVSLYGNIVYLLIIPFFLDMQLECE